MLRRALAALVLLACAACQSDDDKADGVFVMPQDQVEEHDGAYVHEVVTGDGDELIALRSNSTIEEDLGNWFIEVGGDQRLTIPPSTFISVDGELRVHIGQGENDGDDVYAGLDAEVLDDEAGTVVLRDVFGGEVSRFEYGD